MWVCVSGCVRVGVLGPMFSRQLPLAVKSGPDLDVKLLALRSTLAHLDINFVT